MDMHRSRDIKKLWDDRAQQFGADQRATLGETDLRDLEINAILKYLKDGMKVLDVGCGNGYSTIKFAKERNIEITGIDYSEKMVCFANRNLDDFRVKEPIKSKILFMQQDVLKMDFPQNHFDAVISERCLQNLSNWEEQRKAIVGIADVLKPSGLFIMLECSITSLDKLIRALNLLSRKEPSNIMPWHNTFFSDRILLDDVSILKKLIFLKIDDFASTYTLITRLFSSNLILKKYLKHLPSIGSFGYNKIFLWKKRT